MCLRLANTSIHYLSRSIPSLYDRLDFFQSTTFSSHRIGISWVDPKEGFHLCLSPSRAFVLPRIPNRTRTFDFVSHPLVVVDDLAFPLTPVLSMARLGTCTSLN